MGLVVNLEPKSGATPAEEARAATARADAYMNRQYLDPVLLGKYPEELREIFGEAWPTWPAADLELIRQPLDFLGVNYYTRNVTRANGQSWPLPPEMGRQPPPTDAETAPRSCPSGLTA